MKHRSLLTLAALIAVGALCWTLGRRHAGPQPAQARQTPLTVHIHNTAPTATQAVVTVTRPNPTVTPTIARPPKLTTLPVNLSRLGNLSIARAGGVQVILPSVKGVNDGPRIALSSTAPTPPDGLSIIGQAYSINPPAGVTALPAQVSLPLPDPSIARDRTRSVFVAHHDGKTWHIVPARIIGNQAVAEVQHFSTFAVMLGLRRDRPDADELARLRIEPPKFFGIYLRGPHARIELDISPCRTAYTGQRFSRGIAVEKLRVYVSRPAPGLKLPSMKASAYLPYRDPLATADEGDLFLRADGPDHQSIPLGFDMSASMDVTATDTPGTAYPWSIRLAPVFADGSEGPPSEPVRIFAGTAEAHLKLREGLLKNLDTYQRFWMSDALGGNPCYLFFDHWYFADVYSRAPSSLREHLNGGLWTAQPFAYIRLNSDSSEFDRVVTHEWGHHIARLVYGEEAYDRLDGGSHKSHTQLTSRSFAWGEDLATFFGQYGTGQGVPAGAGAMAGRVRDFSRNSAEENQAHQRWPQTRNMDATRVEGVPATVLSRAALMHGLPKVVDYLRDHKPMDVVEFFQFCRQKHSLPLHLSMFQSLYLDEGLAWRVRGRVVAPPEQRGPKPRPIDQAVVTIHTLLGGQLGKARVQTDSEGRFEALVPPGPVRFQALKTGFEQKEPFEFTVRTDGSTLDDPQAMPDLVLRPQQQLQLLTIRRSFNPKQWNIYSMGPAGENPQQLVSLPSDLLYPVAWSPGGEVLLYNQRFGADNDLDAHRDIGFYDFRHPSMPNAQGTGVAYIRRENRCFDWPTWSRNASAIAVICYGTNRVRARDDSSWIEIQGSNGVKSRHVKFDTPAENRVDWMPPALSPDGRQVAFIRKTGELKSNPMASQQDLFVSREEFPLPRQITRNLVAREPSWTPDGRCIAFLAREDKPRSETGVYVVAPDGQDLNRITPAGRCAAGIYQPSWSADGSLLAIFEGDIANPMAPKQLVVMDRDGGSRRVLARLNSEDRRDLTSSPIDAPLWSHDGKFLAFVLETFAPGGRHMVKFLYCVEIETGTVKCLGEGGAPAWRLKPR